MVHDQCYTGCQKKCDFKGCKNDCDRGIYFCSNTVDKDFGNQSWGRSFHELWNATGIWLVFGSSGIFRDLNMWPW